MKEKTLNDARVCRATAPTHLRWWLRRYTQPDSPLKAILAEAEARFGPVIPPELASEARNPSLEEINAYVTTMPGKVYASEYTAAAGHRWGSHIVDPVFLRAWMEHPNFRMIK